ncbi:MAG: NAD(P)H-binding protein [Acidimicrobiia bacterium]|nr:NAD(P)H-binding protein [Acidimicrobiia bacterium]
MPVIVVGADTEHGRAVAEALSARDGEVRAFVTDPNAAQPLRARGIKVAVGDVSDASHIAGAALGAFSAVLIAEAGRDDRERSFAASHDALLRAWAEGLRDAGVSRVIWVAPGDNLPEAVASSSMEGAVVDTRERDTGAVAAEAARLDDLADLEPS